MTGWQRSLRAAERDYGVPSAAMLVAPSGNFGNPARQAWLLERGFCKASQAHGDAVAGGYCDGCRMRHNERGRAGRRQS